jgi:hypothetical protein
MRNDGSWRMKRQGGEGLRSWDQAMTGDMGEWQTKRFLGRNIYVLVV